MLFKDFKEIITLLQDCDKVMSESYNVVRPELFEKHNTLISVLLTQVYGKESVDFILNEWLCGNKSPVILTQDDGTKVSIPVKSLSDLWKAMEQFRKIKAK